MSRLPLLTIKPESLVGLVPLVSKDNSIKLSLITWLVVSILVEVPFTVKSPSIVTLPLVSILPFESKKKAPDNNFILLNSGLLMVKSSMNVIPSLPTVNLILCLLSVMIS